jgi:spermidine/putrescine ABC transporter ATP-binding subunit
MNGTPYTMIEITGLTKAFGTYTAIDALTLKIAQGEFFALLGASGSGKTTLLRLLGGFEFPEAGRIVIDGQDVTGLRPNQRPTNTVFQSYALFPHLTLAENVGYGLLNQRLPKAEVAARVEDALARVRLSGFGGRFPHMVSGGQRQRVALARALICKPKVLLLDEPLGALDKRLREEMHLELREIQRAAGITFVLVTHDQEEAMSLADRIAIMARGRLLQVDTPRALYEAPRSREVAEFISNVNLLDGTCVGHDGQDLRISVAGIGDLRVISGDAALSPGANATLAIRPEKLRFVAAADAGANRLTGTLRAVTYAGDRNHAIVDVPGLERPLLVTTPNRDRHLSEPVTPGAAVIVTWESTAAALLTD